MSRASVNHYHQHSFLDKNSVSLNVVSNIAVAKSTTVLLSTNHEGVIGDNNIDNMSPIATSKVATKVSFTTDSYTIAICV